MNKTLSPTSPKGNLLLHTIEIEKHSFDLVFAKSGYMLLPRGQGEIPFKVTLLNASFPSMKDAKLKQLQDLSSLIDCYYIAQIKKSGRDYEVTYQLKSLSQFKRVVSPKKTSDDKRDSKVNQLISSWECKTPPHTSSTTSSKLKGTSSPKEVQTVSILNLSSTVNKFLASDKKVLLVLADPGSNITSLCKDLQNNLKQENKSSSRNIHHLQIKAEEKIEDDTKIISNFIMKEHGLKELADIFSLRETDSFVFICEGVETLGINLYVRNDLSKWNAHIIFVCNSFAVSNDSEIYIKRFAPLKSDRTGAKVDQFERLSLSPLDEKEKTTLWKDYPKYQAKVKDLGLKPLLSNPLFLSIIADIVPKAISPGKSSSNIFAQVVDEWFVRQGDLKLEAKKFCIKLAKAMKDADVVEYEPPEEDDLELPKFEEFFGQKNRNLLSISPIKREGNMFSFLDPSLKKFFASL